MPAALALDTELGRPALRVGMLLSLRANAEGECWLAIHTMARLLKMPRSVTIKALGQLVERGHVLRQPRTKPGRGQVSSIYTLQFRDVTGPVTGDRQKRSPGDRFSTVTGDRFSTGPVTASSGHDHERIEMIDHERAREREAESSTEGEERKAARLQPPHEARQGAVAASPPPGLMSLRYAGAGVKLLRRRGDGRVVVVAVDRDGKPKGSTTAAIWPHQLIGVGQRMQELKKFIAALPIEGAQAQPQPARPRLFAHHVADNLKD